MVFRWLTACQKNKLIKIFLVFLKIECKFLCLAADILYSLIWGTNLLTAWQIVIRIWYFHVERKDKFGRMSKKLEYRIFLVDKEPLFSLIKWILNCNLALIFVWKWWNKSMRIIEKRIVSKISKFLLKNLINVSVEA